MTTQEQPPEQTEAEHRPKRKQGFALLAPDQKRAVAQQGGKTAQANGTAYKWTSETARLAGKKGGSTIGRDREHMRAIGSKGGAAKLGYRRNKVEQISEPEMESSDE